MSWLTLALKHWKWIVIGFLICANGLLMLHGRALKAERDAKTLEIEHMRNAAQAYRDQSEITAKAINDDHRLKVEQARKTAYANYLKKYGDNRACGLTVRLPNMPAGAGEASSAPSDHAAESVGVLTRDFLDRASEAAVMIDACQQFVVKNDLEVE